MCTCGVIQEEHHVGQPNSYIPYGIYTAVKIVGEAAEVCAIFDKLDT